MEILIIQVTSKSDTQSTAQSENTCLYGGRNLPCSSTCQPDSAICPGDGFVQVAHTFTQGRDSPVCSVVSISISPFNSKSQSRKERLQIYFDMCLAEIHKEHGLRFVSQIGMTLGIPSLHAKLYIEIQDTLKVHSYKHLALKGLLSV